MDKLRTLAYISLIYGGFLLIAYLVIAYSAFWRNEFIDLSPAPQQRVFNASAFTNNFTHNGSMPFPSPNGREGIRTNEPLSAVLSLPALAILLTGIFLLANGITLLNHIRIKDRKETRHFVVSSLLTEDEKAVYDYLVSQRGEATQKQVASSLGLSPVKAFRVIHRLEGKKVLRTHPFGMTKKVKLEEAA